MRPLPLVFAGLLLACNAAPGPAPAAGPPATQPAPPPLPAPPPALPPSADTPTPSATPAARAPIPGVRDKHPLPGRSDCLEMVSSCSPDGKGGQLCSSMPFMLACGETGKLPGGEALRCVCP